MASGPAIAARFGRRAEQLDDVDRASAAELVGFYLAAGVRSIIYTLAPERIVVGGGLSALPGVATAARAELQLQLAGYPGLPEHDQADFITLALLGPQAGPAGTLILAEQALRPPGPAS
jgi:fructokinase